MRMKNTAVIILIFLVTAVLAAEEEAPPAPAYPLTDIFVADMEFSDGNWKVGAAVNITHRPAYDNQPFFSVDGEQFFYTSERNGQTDLFLWNLETNESRRITNSTESEFSPTIMPDGSGLSTVVIEADGTQRLWRTGFDGSERRVLVPDVTGVGYHAWVGENQIALFIVADPISLHVIDMSTGVVKIMDENIGRALTVYPGQASVLVYTGPGADEKTWVKSLDLETSVIQTLIPVPGEAQDMAWLPDGSLLMSDQGRVMRWAGGEDDRWELLADFSSSLGTSLTRLAVNPHGDKIALVAQHPQD